MRRMLLTLGLGAMLLVGCAVEPSSTSSTDPSDSSQATPAPDEALEILSMPLPPGFTPASFPTGPEVCSQQCPGEACCWGGQHVGWLCC